jgi:hypothetical protein
MAASSSKKFTYIVSGDTRSGTTMMMWAHHKGGIELCYNTQEFGDYEDVGYPTQVLEWQGNPPPSYELQGRCIKSLTDNVLRLPVVGPLKVVYMLRDPTVRAALYGGHKTDEVENYWRRQMNCMRKVSQLAAVDSFVAADYDDVISNPHRFFHNLHVMGWELDPSRAAFAVDPKQRHGWRENNGDIHIIQRPGYVRAVREGKQPRKK